MFMRAGTGGAQKRKGHGVASAQDTSSSSSVGTSPAKLIENRSKATGRPQQPQAIWLVV